MIMGRPRLARGSRWSGTTVGDRAIDTPLEQSEEIVTMDATNFDELVKTFDAPGKPGAGEGLAQGDALTGTQAADPT
jgi:hypothetical protein